MGNISSTNNQPLVNTQNLQKPAAAKPELGKTTLEKFGETKLGTFYKDSPVLSGVATGITALGVVGLGLKNHGLGELLFSRGTGGVLAGGTGAVLLEDGIKDIREGSELKGSIKAGVGGIGVLGGAELLTKVPVLSKPVEVVFKNGYATGGTALAAGAAYMIKDGVEDLANGDKLAGGLKTAAGVAGGLGATELVGRQFGKSLIIEPMVKLSSTKAAQGTGAVLGGAAAAGLVTDGAQRLAENGSFLNDAAGLAEVAGGALLATGSTSLAGHALGSEALKTVMPKTAKQLGGAALVGTSYVLGKEAVKNLSKNGVTYLGTAAATGAALSALGAAETFGVNRAFTKGGQFAAAAGVGVASGLLAKSAIEDLSDGKLHEGALKGFGAVVGGGAALALADVPGVRQVGEKVLKGAWEGVIAPVGEFAVKNPLVAIPLAVGGAYAVYKLTDKGGKAEQAEAPQAEAKPVTEK